MSEELKPCPFCGGPAIHNDGGNSTYGRLWWAVGCEECLVEIRDRELWAEGAKLDPAYPPKECFTRWNARHDAEIKELRAKLFPYADATEIGGISWDGKYLIGDKASISFFHEMKNRGEQIDVYKRAYDERIAAKDAEIEALRSELTKAKSALHEVRIEAFQREPVPSSDAVKNTIRGTALALSGRLGGIEQVCRSALKGDAA